MIKRAQIDEAAASLRATLPVFSRGNLFHAVRRLSRDVSLSRGAFDGALSRRLERGPLDGLVSHHKAPTARLSAVEQRAYFPAGILVVDQPDVVDLFAASGALVQARVAVVDLHGYPRNVVRWLIAGARAGRSAPIGYLHDATTVLYPFAFEPLSSLTRADSPVAYRDLGIRPYLGLRDASSPAFELEAVTPAALISYALRSVLEMIEPDQVLAPYRHARPNVKPR